MTWVCWDIVFICFCLIVIDLCCGIMVAVGLYRDGDRFSPRARMRPQVAFDESEGGRVLGGGMYVAKEWCRLRSTM